MKDFENPAVQKKKGRKKTIIMLGILLILIAGGLIGYYLMRSEYVPPIPVPSQAESLPEYAPGGESGATISPTDYYPTDKLFITKEREEYASGDLVLEIPRIDFKGPVLNNTTDASLKKGVGLYDYAQPPGYGNTNTSIAGHRDMYGYEFYYLDKIIQGDLMYLYFNELRYVYEYVDTVVIEEDDWSPIYCKNIPILTLTTCTPVGIASHRMVVTGKLIRVEKEAAEQAQSAPAA